MASIAAKGGLREIQIAATVLGPCRYCGQGAEHWPANPGCDHEPTFQRDLGVISRWHKNPLVRALWRLKGQA